LKSVAWSCFVISPGTPTQVCRRQFDVTVTTPPPPLAIDAIDQTERALPARGAKFRIVPILPLCDFEFVDLSTSPIFPHFAR